MSTIACDIASQSVAHSRSALDESAWLAVCEQIAADAQRRCGLSYSYYVELFSLGVDEQLNRLPESQRAQALHIATQEWDYATPADRQATQDWNAENGFCTHGIELGYCPAGCGS